jgi:hypothetical protein
MKKVWNDYTKSCAIRNTVRNVLEVWVKSEDIVDQNYNLGPFLTTVRSTDFVGI